MASQWAWLGDMELDDTLLGLGATGVFGRPPAAIGFIVNAAHCAEKGKPSGLKASEMFSEKLAFLQAFFCNSFYPVLDRFPHGGKGRSWVGDLSLEELQGLGEACGLQDELIGWVSRVKEVVKKNSVSVLHLLISGPLVGRGQELCDSLKQAVLAGTETKIVFWMYAGSFNLTHSSDADRQHLSQLFKDFSGRVFMLETTLKSGAWLAEPPRPFWGTSCPTAWTTEAAKKNPVAFDVSTDIQSVNMFLEEYSSPAPSPGSSGLRGVFQGVASGGAAAEVSKLLSELEARSLSTNLTKMVQPDSSSMGKVREAIPPSQSDLDEAFSVATAAMEQFRSAPQDRSAAELQKFISAASKYAELYRGCDGKFLEAGCTECFPKDKPYSGPRLDKRCILRCMAQGKLQGGPTADVLVLLALLLFRKDYDNSPPASAEAVCWPLSMCVGAQAAPVALPQSTLDLFQKTPSSAGVETVELKPTCEMGPATKEALAPLVDE
eukprot:CAMPEP_0178395674 /NCGR_PEP_ID=MMETSP0689_2-20121128/13340_1 /TAXON_ID=160604 /ORGANISM="Amphidinium massartii, Strain CS-259" /LENGTH=491 /DNA_ID=CAMNT_0020016335 /DNA_START=20 /DNA_END=1492 /DNA_ORIENTATION=+